MQIVAWTETIAKATTVSVSHNSQAELCFPLQYTMLLESVFSSVFLPLVFVSIVWLILPLSMRPTTYMYAPHYKPWDRDHPTSLSRLKFDLPYYIGFLYGLTLPTNEMLVCHVGHRICCLEFDGWLYYSKTTRPRLVDLASILDTNALVFLCKHPASLWAHSRLLIPACINAC